MNPDLPYIIGFSKAIEIGPVKFSQIISLFKTAETAWKAPINEFYALKFNDKLISSIDKVRRETDPEKEYKKCEKLGIKVLIPNDENYPTLLKEIYDPPFVLYLRGNIKREDSLSLAVVGSRRMSSYGYSVIEYFIPKLCYSGLVIVSGLAFGVDAASHKAALAAGGRCLAILASGVDNISPVANSKIAEKIIEEDLGAVISEFPLGVQPQPFYFPRRNRIISGLSLGVLVVEAAEKSGSLITASSALEQGRDVFSVPASIFNQVGVGTNRLIKNGAIMVTRPEDVLSELNVSGLKKQSVAQQTYPLIPEESMIIELVGGEELYIDEIVRLSGLTISAVNNLLTLLEIKGMVKNIGNGYYRRVN